MGYYPSWVSPPGPDGGLDIVAYPDPLGKRPPRIKVQVKRNAQAVDESGFYDAQGQICASDYRP